MDRKKRLLGSGFLLPVGLAHADVYQWVDSNGKVHFGDRKPPPAQSERLTLKINTYTQVTYDESIFDIGPVVVMYATYWCRYCRKARIYFNKNGIVFTEYDIEKSSAAKRRYTQMGAHGVPVILVGDQRMNRFSEQGFERIYE